MIRGNSNPLKKFFLALFCLTGCGAPEDFWVCDTIAVHQPAFTSKRLVHTSANGYPPWNIELLKIEGTTQMFISLTQGKFRPLLNDSQHIHIALHIEDSKQGKVTILEGLGSLFEGNMKISFPDSLSNDCILALQEGQKVSIVIDMLQETLEPNAFQKKISTFLKTDDDWHINIQTPLN
ncbi:MAG: hypothetical protein Q8L98_04165 [Chlamydiales bacterium]|nr:hypothetical protein [Chlamydiales bacterium]